MWLRLTGGLRLGLEPHLPLADVVDCQDDKRPLLRDALATAPIYGVCGHGPSDPAPQFAGANFANPPLVGTGPLTPLKALIALIQCRHPPQCFSGARGHGGLSAAGTRNAHRCAMRLQRCLYYGVCGYGPSGPAPKSAGAGFSSAGTVNRDSKLKGGRSL